MATATKINGSKGGSSSSRTPVEQPDDLQSIAKAKLLIALGEGEFGESTRNKKKQQTNPRIRRSKII